MIALCQELIRQDHQVLLILNQLHDPNYAKWLRQTKIPYITTSDLQKLSRRLKSWKPQIIHNHSSHTLLSTIHLGKRLHIPTVTTVHYLNFDPLDLLGKQDAVILISHEMKETFGVLQVPTYVVQNGVSLPRIKQSKSWNKQALLLATVTPDKKKNFQNISESLLSWGWQVESAGNWRYQGVKHLGWVYDVEPVLKRVNLVVGTGRAVREAMAAGKPAWVLGSYSDGMVTPDNVGNLETTNFSGRFGKKTLSKEDTALHLEEPSQEIMQSLVEF